MSKGRNIAIAWLLSALFWAAAFAAEQHVLRTTPAVAGASVYVDGTYVGPTDENGKIALSGAPGVHLLRVESGGESYTAEVTFDPELNALPPFAIGSPASPGNPLQAGEIDYRIDVNVAEAEVVVDGTALAQTDSAGRAMLRLTSGQPYTIEISKGRIRSARRDDHPDSEGRTEAVVAAAVRTAAESRRCRPTRPGRASRRKRRAVAGHRDAPSRSGVNVTSPLAMRAGAATPESNIGHFDRYRLISTLGNGGVATIYRAFDLVDKLLIALKVLDAMALRPRHGA